MSKAVAFDAFSRGNTVMKKQLATLLLALCGFGCAGSGDEAFDESGTRIDGRADNGGPARLGEEAWDAHAVPIYPEGAEDFFVLADGTDLRTFDHDRMLKRNRGLGQTFGAAEQQQYLAWKTDPRIHWVVSDLETGDLLAESENSGENVYGASAAKSIAVAALLWRTGGQLSADTWHRVIRLIAESDNAQWAHIEALAGGAAGIQEFSDAMGYESMKAYRGVNQINARDMAIFLSDMHNRTFDGAEALLKIMASNQWSYYRSQTYIPTNVFMGGKTGTYGINNNEVAYIEVDGHRYGISVLSTAGGSNSKPVALVFGGLAREYLGVQ